MIVSDARRVRELYAMAGEKGWVLPCLCTENLTTTEAVFCAAQEFARERGVDGLPVVIAITNRYGHRSQSVNYTHTRDWKTGLKLFASDVKALAASGGVFDRLNVMMHLDHIQYDLDAELLSGDLSDYASILYDASALPLNENIARTAEFVKKRGHEIVIEGACDEIFDAAGGKRGDLTTAERARRYLCGTGADMIVANLGTEHRASGQDLQYRGGRAREIKEKIGSRIVLHGASSVPNDQIKELYSDGVCKVNIWTALERDSSPALFEALIKNACRAAGPNTVARLVREGFLTEKCLTGENAAISHFTTAYRQQIVFQEMKKMARAYFDMWYI